MTVLDTGLATYKHEQTKLIKKSMNRSVIYTNYTQDDLREVYDDIDHDVEDYNARYRKITTDLECWALSAEGRTVAVIYRLAEYHSALINSTGGEHYKPIA